MDSYAGRLLFPRYEIVKVNDKIFFVFDSKMEILDLGQFAMF